MRMHVLTLICLSISFAACSSPRIIEKPVPIEVEVTKYVPVPANFLARGEKTPVADSITYGDAIQQWSQDRATIEILNAQLDAIESLEHDDGEN